MAFALHQSTNLQITVQKDLQQARVCDKRVTTVWVGVACLWSRVVNLAVASTVNQPVYIVEGVLYWEVSLKLESG